MNRAGIAHSTYISGWKSSADNLQVLAEEEFNHNLTLERKRSERSLKPLLLLLMDVTCLTRKADGQREVAVLLEELAGLIREIDLCGWYRHGELVAVLFPEIPADAVNKARDVIEAKIKGRLSTMFLPSVCENITLTFHIFPEKYDGGEMQEKITVPFYPELVNVGQTELWAQRFKRGMDVIGSLAALILFSPFFIVIPLLIKITSPGPVFFRQERLGQFGRSFKFLKFRSMHVNNDDAIHRQFIKDFIADKVATDASGDEPVIYKIRKDPRLTPIGDFLRRSSLDELPQFINVLKGDMSLVGPRPPIPYEVVDYELWHRRRILDQKPGITGLWQVTGRSLTTFDGMVRLDLRYGRTRSLWFDIKLLLKTPLAVIRGKGAY